jgi:hypothetical protein
LPRAAIILGHQRRIRRQRRRGSDHMRQRVPFDGNRLGRVARPIERVGRGESNRVTDVPHLPARKDRIGRSGELGLRYCPLAGQIAELDRILTREHQRHARHRPCFGGIGDAKARVRMGGT